MKPQTTLQSSFSTFMVVFLTLTPLYSNEMVVKDQPQSFSFHLLVDDEGTAKEKSHSDFNAMGNKKGVLNDLKPEQSGSEKKHTDEEKHNNHVYSYDWIKSKKRILINILRYFTKVFISVCYIAVLLSGYMSIIH